MNLLIPFMNTILSFCEIRMCYWFIYRIIGIHENSTTKTKLMLISNILLSGILFSLNRNIIIFSYPIFTIGIVFTTLSLCYIIKNKRIQTTGLIVIFYSIISLLDICGLLLFIYFFKGIDALQIYYAASLCESMIFFFSRCIVFALLWIFLKNNNLFFKTLIEYKKSIMLFGIMMAYILREFQQMLVYILNGKVYHKDITILYFLFAILILIGFLLFIFFRSLFLQNEIELLAANDKLLQQNYRELMTAIENNHRLTHDVKHHLLRIQDYETQGNYDELHLYLNNIVGTFTNTTPSVWTGNRILDFLLNQKKLLAESKSIKMDIESSALLKLPLSESDICVLFGNLLDNAIEECARLYIENPWIKIRIKKQQQLFFIHISNSSNPNKLVQDGIYNTEKELKHLHGYGLKSVQRIVEKHDGIMSIQNNSNSFKVDITFFYM